MWSAAGPSDEATRFLSRRVRDFSSPAQHVLFRFAWQVWDHAQYFDDQTPHTWDVTVDELLELDRNSIDAIAAFLIGWARRHDVVGGAK